MTIAFIIVAFYLGMLTAGYFAKDANTQLKAERDRALESTWAAERRAEDARKREYKALDLVMELRRAGQETPYPNDEKWETPYVISNEFEHAMEQERKTIDQKSSPLVD